jgi:Mg2+/Co2+ transporter CorC
VDKDSGEKGERSIGGVLVRALGRIPQIGERFRIVGLDVTVVQAEPSRLLRLLVQRADAAAPVELAIPR